MVEPIRDSKTVRRILDYLKETNKRNHVMFAIGVYTGLRISDILELKVRDVKNKRTIKLRVTKTGKTKTIAIHKELEFILNQYVKDKKQGEYLIKSRKGINKPISRTQAYRIVKDLEELFEIDNIGTHSLRKTYGRKIYTDTKDIVLTQKALDHVHPSYTLRYIGEEQERVDRVTLNLKY